MHEQLLTQIGLEPDQAAIYEIMLKTGTAPARKIALQAPYKRPYVYKVLDQLIKLGLTEKQEERNKVAVFSPLHPTKLRELAQKKLESAQIAKTRLENTLGKLISDFNLISGKPGVQFFEGHEGALKVIEDSFSAKTEILSYVDSEAVDKYFGADNEMYLKKRSRTNIKKRIIYLDGGYIRKRRIVSNLSLTQIRLVPAPAPFAAVMQIYDNKVTYITLEPEKIVGVIIEHPNITLLHRNMFESTWSIGTPWPETNLPVSPPASRMV